MAASSRGAAQRLGDLARNRAPILGDLARWVGGARPVVQTLRWCNVFVLR